MDNNLFNYATSELSQDAFICWLLSFAKQESKDEKLKEVAQALIRKFIEYKINYKKAENKTEIEDSGIDEEHDLIVKNIYKQYKLHTTLKNAT